MTPIIDPRLIYLAGIGDNLSTFLCVVGGLGAVIALFCIIFGRSIVAYNYSENGPTMANWDKYRKVRIFSFIIALMMWASGFLVPTQKTVYTMMVASQLTPNNIAAVGGSIQNVADYLFTKAEALIKASKGGIVSTGSESADILKETLTTEAKQKLYNALKKELDAR